MLEKISRRSLVKGAASLSIATALGGIAAGNSRAATIRDMPRRLTSLNGWIVEDHINRVSTVWTRSVAGTGLKFDVRIGDVEEILLHLIRRFHYEVDEIPQGQLVGWTPLERLKKNLPESNLASGTAVRIRPGAHAKGGFFPLQEAALRDILADCKGVVRWGGDDARVDESLFYIDTEPHDTQVNILADNLRLLGDKPGSGPGVEVDILSASRRQDADRLRKSQRANSR